MRTAAGIIGGIVAVLLAFSLMTGESPLWVARVFWPWVVAAGLLVLVAMAASGIVHGFERLIPPNRK